MALRSTHDAGQSIRATRNGTLASAMLIGCVIGLGPNDAEAAGAFCSNTAKAMHNACGFEVRNDYWVAAAVCINENEAADRKECNAEATASRNEGNELCQEQLLGRVAACELLGEARVDPEFEPRMFIRDYTRLSKSNRYFPLRIGNRWEYAGGTATNTVEILNETKLIDEVQCIVSRDTAYDEGKLAEATDDWFAQAKDGNVWYCGEEVKNYETFEGDLPQRPELVNLDGSFKADRDGDRPGIIFQATPQVGQVYRDEFALGEAEDISMILAITYSYGVDKELDRFVPPRLARLLCSSDCVVVDESSPLEPGIFGRKYYAAGIGIFLEVNPDTGEITQLVDCNFDRRCRSLPPP